MRSQAIHRRLARLEALQAQKEAARQPGYDLSTWTDKQLEAAVCMLTGLPDDTRLTNEQLEKIMAGDYETT